MFCFPETFKTDDEKAKDEFATVVPLTDGFVIVTIGGFLTTTFGLL